MIKKVFLLVIVLLLGNMTVVKAINAVISTNYTEYRILSEEDKTVELISLFFWGDTLIIPSTVTYNDVDYTVTSIADDLLYEGNIKGFETLLLPATLKRIGKYAFFFNSFLKSFNLPEGLEEVGEAAFASSLVEELHIPASVRYIGPSAFNSSRLKHITVEEDNAVYDSREDCNAIVESATSKLITGCNNTRIPASIKIIGNSAFGGCNEFVRVALPEGLTAIESYAFGHCSRLQEIELPHSLVSIGWRIFAYCNELESITVRAATPPRVEKELGVSVPMSKYHIITLYVPKGSGYDYREAPEWKNFTKVVEIEMSTQKAYRPFVEDGKVWKVGDKMSNPVQRVEYYYFDGDTIVGGKTCKQMMRQRYVSPDHPDYAILSQYPDLSYVGAWYEEDKKVYEYNTTDKQFKLMYDFSVDANATLQIHGQSYVIGSKQSGGIKGFKGVYRDVMILLDGELSAYNTTWLEGVGGIDGPMANVYYGKEGHPLFLMSCTVGDEVIYLNDEYEDGATPEGLGARKRRFDFTHTIKTQPKARQRSNAAQSPYGEYNDLQLGINLDPLDDAYQVRITDDSGKVVYEKSVNAGTIVGLNIDISAYAKGRYTVTVENSTESFTGEFEAQTTGIRDVRCKKEEVRNTIYNLQGQRISSLQKGLNIVNGQKVYVK